MCFRPAPPVRMNVGAPIQALTPHGIAAMFAERQADRYDMHSRHLNEQMVRVLRTIGYDVQFCRGTGQYLFDAAGARYLDLLSGFGVFGIGRNHPALRDALKERARQRAAESRAARCVDARRHPRRAAVGARPLSRQGVLRQLRRRGRGRRDQVRAHGDRPAGPGVLRPRLSRADQRRAVAQRRCRVP